ncbi:MAG: Fic family protein [Endomicrobium sp.]|jgi:Fic family protein|nr:Fic family protein [Endomicrobium sp.]
MLTETMIKELHFMLKIATNNSRLAWFKVGDYKLKPNTAGEQDTCPPNQVHKEIRNLLDSYNAKAIKHIGDVCGFHQKFEKIHPFQDGNGRFGRLIMFKECNDNKERLIDACLSAQDKFKQRLQYFNISLN